MWIFTNLETWRSTHVNCLSPNLNLHAKIFTRLSTKFSQNWLSIFLKRYVDLHKNMKKHSCESDSDIRWGEVFLAPISMQHVLQLHQRFLHACMYNWKYTHMPTWTSCCVCVCVCVWTLTCIHMSIQICVPDMCTCIYINIYICMQHVLRLHQRLLHAYMYICKYTHMPI